MSTKVTYISSVEDSSEDQSWLCEEVVIPFPDRQPHRSPPDSQTAGQNPGRSSARRRIEPGARQEVVQLEPGQLHEYAAAAERILRDVIYTQNGRMVRLARGTELDEDKKGKKDSLQRDPNQIVILPASAEWLRRRLSERARFEKFDARSEKWKVVDVPEALARHIAQQGEWPAWRELAGVANAPFLRADLTLCDRPGYDPVSEVYLRSCAGFPAIPAAPSRADAAAALDRLLEPFAEFPFDSPASRSALAAHILTACGRHAVDVRPVFVYTAPAAGTGKSLLAGCANLIAEGSAAPARTWPDDETELKKSLLASLLVSDPTMLFDNVQSGTKVRSPALCALSTSAAYSDRILGVTQLATALNRSIVVLTGNNLTPAGDLARRSIVVRQDAGLEKVRGRVFKINDLRQHLREHRAELLADALIILRAYSLADDKISAPALPSFENWSRVCRDPLIWLGLPDPTETQDAEADDDSEGLCAAFAAIRDRLGAGDWSAGELESAADERILGERSARAAQLADALAAAGLSEPRRARYWLREHRDRVAGGRKLVQLGKHAGAGRWAVREV